MTPPIVAVAQHEAPVGPKPAPPVGCAHGPAPSGCTETRASAPSAVLTSSPSSVPGAVGVADAPSAARTRKRLPPSLVHAPPKAHQPEELVGRGIEMQLEVRGAELLRVGGIALLGTGAGGPQPRLRVHAPATRCPPRRGATRGGQVGAVDRDGDRLIDRPRVEALVERHERDAPSPRRRPGWPARPGPLPPARQQ